MMPYEYPKAGDLPSNTNSIEYVRRALYGRFSEEDMKVAVEAFLDHFIDFSGGGLHAELFWAQGEIPDTMDAIENGAVPKRVPVTPAMLMIYIDMIKKGLVKA